MKFLWTALTFCLLICLVSAYDCEWKSCFGASDHDTLQCCGTSSPGRWSSAGDCEVMRGYGKIFDDCCWQKYRSPTITSNGYHKCKHAHRI
ncbi:hypothetical protein BCV72DRAFT_91091 [Rhizopus microsporus var. microsporus]|uniref:Uncharacterized protein n=2 Tax=Rhizopus microsporus TaxID=58291 RepID=A0A2G4TAJ7_RHIZD|nr:uncharacterized protein RHIMIDRAFT_255450 [Rhizopus microsporus ATCC 52813]ORE00901.1 hypothetical protein BCV72DRAFT_91091 [Rhizopus microsporus var. microsporus]PHZ18044.1 hypothetical protein RHIMIDRAFT_255450 [Rhizopus microsporus ATCC 52813]